MTAIILIITLRGTTPAQRAKILAALPPLAAALTARPDTARPRNRVGRGTRYPRRRP